MSSLARSQWWILNCDQKDIASSALHEASIFSIISLACLNCWIPKCIFFDIETPLFIHHAALLVKNLFIKNLKTVIGLKIDMGWDQIQIPHIQFLKEELCYFESAYHYLTFKFKLH